LVWGFTSGIAQFVLMAMFVQAFWFGSKLVRENKIEPGDVMAVFWACLIATSNLQMCIPQFIVFSKGKFAIADLLGILPRLYLRLRCHPLVRSLHAKSNLFVKSLLSDVLANSR
jgi:hypothetical protein